MQWLEEPQNDRNVRRKVLLEVLKTSELIAFHDFSITQMSVASMLNQRQLQTKYALK